MGLLVEELSVGQSWTTSDRLVGESDVNMFAGLVGDFTPIHVDPHFAAKSLFGSRIAHGPLTMSMAIGLFAQLDVLGDSVLGLLNLTWDFSGPVRLGETIRATVTVVEARISSRPGAGVVVFAFDVATRDGTSVQRGRMTVLMKARGPAEAEPAGGKVTE